MDTLTYKTISLNKETIKKEWFVIDAEGQVLGRLATKVAKILRGKNKPGFTPHVDCGDYVIIVNADKIRLTGNKWDDREHFSYTGYPGGQRVATPRDLFNKSPERLIKHSVKGMLPKNRLSSVILKHLYVYSGTGHNHEGQNPVSLNINSIK